MIGALYLTDKEDADAFGDDDERVIEMLAAHAAIAIENARLHELSRELSIVEERNRLARELHDAVSQKLFGVVLTAESAATLLDRDPDAAREQLTRLGGLAREAQEELRALIDELRPPSLAIEGLATALRKHVAVLRRVFGVDVGLRVAGAPRLDPEAEGEVFRIAQEALQNAVRHSHAERVEVRLEADNGRVDLAVADDGIGFEAGQPRAPRAAPRLDLDGGASPRGRRRADDRVRARRGYHRAPRGRRMTAIRVLIADDHAVVRQGLRTFLDLQEDLEVVGEAADGGEAVAVAEREAPDVVLMDLVMPGMDGIAAIRASARARARGARDRADELRRRRAGVPRRTRGRRRLPAQGRRAGELVRAIRAVHAGQSLVHPAVASRLLEELAATAPRPVAPPAKSSPPASARSCA